MAFLSVCTTETLIDAADALMGGSLVAFPTETVYGLGADAESAEAVARIYSVKGRPANHPLIVHIDSIDRMGEWSSDIPAYAIALARDYWPGPMTLVLKRSEIAGDFITGGQETVGLRVPAHPLALGLLQAFVAAGGRGIAAPSANLILDGGPSLVGLESTIIDCTGDAPRVLRLGAITHEMIEETTGLKVIENDTAPEIRVSGSLESHYSPKAKVLLDVVAEAGDGLIAPDQIPTPNGVIRLMAPSTIEQYARDLYRALRMADQQGLEIVVVLQPGGDGLAAAIRDRLQRAAHE